MGIVIERGICGHEDCGECTIGRPLADLAFYMNRMPNAKVGELKLPFGVIEQLKRTNCCVPFAASVIQADPARCDAIYLCLGNDERCEYFLLKGSVALEEWKSFPQAVRDYVDFFERQPR